MSTSGSIEKEGLKELLIKNKKGAVYAAPMAFKETPDTYAPSSCRALCWIMLACDNIAVADWVRIWFLVNFVVS